MNKCYSLNKHYYTSNKSLIYIHIWVFDLQHFVVTQNVSHESVRWAPLQVLSSQIFFPIFKNIFCISSCLSHNQGYLKLRV